MRGAARGQVRLRRGFGSQQAHDVLRQLPAVVTLGAVVHAKLQTELQPRDPSVCAKGCVVKGGGDPVSHLLFAAWYGVVGEPEVLASQQKSLWKTVIATLVENLNRRQTIDRLFGGGLGVDHGERSVEAREGADHVLHESQFQVHA